MKVFQVWDVGFSRYRLRSPDTVRSDISRPSISNSPWILGAPHDVFASAIWNMSARTSGSTAGLPHLSDRDFRRQYSLKALLCQRTIVSGWTIITVLRHPDQTHDKITQNIRSRSFNFGRFWFRLSTLSCWRRARFSALKFPTIFSWRNTQEPYFLIRFSIEQAYTTNAETSMISMRMIKCEAQV